METLMVIATVFIAIFAGLSWRTTTQIKKDAAKRDDEINNILEQLIAATLVSGPGAGSEQTMARSFNTQLNELRKLK